MALILADPIFFHTIRRQDGSKRKLIHFTNNGGTDLQLTVASLEKPEWLEFEDLYESKVLHLPQKKKIPFTVNLNTTHRKFPENEYQTGQVKITFEESHIQPLSISIILPEIHEKGETFQGIFSMDFGTTNSCFAYHSEHDDVDSEDVITSSEIPSLVFFHDVSSKTNPKYTIGNEAKFDIREHSSQTYSYFLSVKRQLGQTKKITVLDRLAGIDIKHHQSWRVEDIASFIIRSIMEKAEQELGRKITSVVATYPTLFTEDKKQALEDAFAKAFLSQGKEFGEGTLVLDLDETNAAAYSYIYGTMLEEFRKYDIREKKSLLLSFDFGGGTIDISLIEASISRDDRGRVIIRTDIKGLSGERYYGGDNVTLALFQILKNKLALRAAQKRVAPPPPPVEEETKSEVEDDDPWATTTSAAEEKEDDIWGLDSSPPPSEPESTDEGEESDETKAEEIEEEEDVDVVNMENPDRYEQALKYILDHQDAIERSVAKGVSLLDSLEEIEREEDTYISHDQTRLRAQKLDGEIELVCPTRYSKYEDTEPEKYETARKLFAELWHEAELLKIRMSSDSEGRGRIEGVLRRLARYTGVDAVHFHEVTSQLDELNAQVVDDITRSIEKAYNLYQNSRQESSGSIVVGSTEEERKDELKFLLYGNASSLPIVREKVKEIFQLDGKDLVFNQAALKTSVARGACEEYALRRRFGERKGLIQYEKSDFLNKLPYSAGLMHKELEMLGFKNGFYPIFERGATTGATKVVREVVENSELEARLTEDSCFLIHPGLKDLPLYADYHDGSPPYYLGWFDLTTPLEDEEEEPRTDEDTPATNVLVFRFELEANRHFQIVNLLSGEKFGFVFRKDSPKDEENPFSGTH